MRKLHNHHRQIITVAGFKLLSIHITSHLNQFADLLQLIAFHNPIISHRPIKHEEKQSEEEERNNTEKSAETSIYEKSSTKKK